MRGFSARATVEAALAWIDAHARRLGPETAALDALHGRVLAADLHAAIDVPPFDRSARRRASTKAWRVRGMYRSFSPISTRIS